MTTFTALTPHRVVEFTFDSPEDAARYFDRKEIALKLKSELPAHSANIHIKVLVLRDDYSKDTVTWDSRRPAATCPGGVAPSKRDT